MFDQVDMMTQGETIFDIVDKRDHAAIEAFLVRGGATDGDDELTFFCRMTVSRNFRRQTGYGDHKVLYSCRSYAHENRAQLYANKMPGNLNRHTFSICFAVPSKYVFNIFIFKRVFPARRQSVVQVCLSHFMVTSSMVICNNKM